MDTNYHLKVNDTFDFDLSEEDIHVLDAIQKSGSQQHILHENQSIDAEVTAADFINKTYTIKINSNSYTIKIGTPLEELIQKMGLSLGETVAINDIKAPMPGLILDILVKAGDKVKAGEYLMVLEAMKMENTLTAPRDGIVKEISVEKGKTVDKGQLLLEME